MLLQFKRYFEWYVTEVKKLMVKICKSIIFFGNTALHSWKLKPVFGIRGIWYRTIRIRILGSVVVTNGSVCGFCSFRHWPSRRLQKIIFLSSQLLCLFLFEGTFTSFFKDKKSQRNHKTGEFKVFLHFFACWWNDPDADPGGSKTCGSRRRGSWILVENF
jgi:hypothetical protein